MKRLTRYTALVASVLVLFVLTAQANTYTWNLDGPGDWSNAANWTSVDDPGGIPNDNTAVAVFGGVITGDRTVNVDGTFVVLEVRFRDTTHKYTLGGSGQLRGPAEAAGTSLGIYIENAATHEISADMAAPHFRHIWPQPMDADATLIISGHLSRYAGTASTFSVSKPGSNPGTVIYRGTAEHVGTFGVTADGRFVIGVDNALSTNTAPTISLTGNARVLVENSDRSLTSGYSANNGGIFDGSNGYSISLAGNASLGGSGDNAWGHISTFIGPGVMTLDGTVTFAHTVSLRTPNASTPGKVILNGDNNASSGSLPSREVRFANAITVGIGSDLAFGAGNLQLQSTGPVFMAEGGARSIANNMNLPAHTLTVGGEHDLTFGGLFSGTGGILKNDACRLTLTNGNNSYSGGTTVNGGTLVVGHAATLGTTGTITVNTNGILAIGSGVDFSRSVTFNAGSGLEGDGTFERGGAWSLPANFTIRPGLGGAVGVLHVTTDGAGLTLGASSAATLDVVFAAGSASKLVVDGPLTISEHSLLTIRGDVTELGSYVLAEADSIIGTFAPENIDVSGLAGRDGRVAYTATQVLYNVEPAGTLISIH